MRCDSAPGCVFCRIVRRQEPAEIVATTPNSVAFVPLNPVTLGHLLVVPRLHVRDAFVDAEVTALVMADAVRIGHRPCNLITSAGEEATQSVMHLHVHVVPRRAGDGLRLPWSDQHRAVPRMEVDERPITRSIVPR